MSNKSEQTICLYDNIGGSYLPIALRLSPYFKKTYFYSPNPNPFPRPGLSYIGKGYEDQGVFQIDDFWNKLNEIDIVILPDSYQSDIGQHLRSIGKMVWGGAPSDVVETNKKTFYDVVERLGLPASNIKYIKGITALKDYLFDKSNLFIKTYPFRGVIETFQYINWNFNNVIFKDLEFANGPMAEELLFIVQDPIDAICEFGSDYYSVGNQIPKTRCFGIETKDAAYISKAEPNPPAPIKYVDETFAAALGAYKHCGWFSTEVRYTENFIPFFNDPTPRCGMPSGLSMISLISNWHEIIPGACKGIFVEPVYKYKYACELIIRTSYSNKNYVPVTFPKEYAPNINLKGSFIIDGQSFIIPFLKETGFELEQIGTVCCWGNDIESVMTEAVSIASQIEAIDVKFDATALDSAKEAIEKVEKALPGYKF